MRAFFAQNDRDARFLIDVPEEAAVGARRACGQTFYEGPDDVHVVGRNASSTKPAKFVVFLIKNKGAPVLVPVE